MKTETFLLESKILVKNLNVPNIFEENCTFKCFTKNLAVSLFFCSQFGKKNK